MTIDVEEWATLSLIDKVETIKDQVKIVAELLEEVITELANEED